MNETSVSIAPSASRAPREQMCPGVRRAIPEQPSDEMELETWAFPSRESSLVVEGVGQDVRKWFHVCSHWGNPNLQVIKNHMQSYATGALDERGK